MRVSPAINRTDSIRHTASIARWVADGLTGLDHLVLGSLLSQPLVRLAQLRRELLAEVRRVEDLAQLDLHTSAERRSLEPLDRLITRRPLPDPMARDDLLRLRERAIGDAPFAALEAYPRAPRGWVQALPRQHHARADELFVVLRHVSQKLRAGHLARLGLRAPGDQNHETHCLSFDRCCGRYPHVEQPRTKSTPRRTFFR